MFRLIMCLVFVVSSTLIGFWFSLKLSNRKRTLECVIDAIIKTKTLIEFGGYEISRVITQSFNAIRGFEKIEDLILNGENFTKCFYECVNTLPSEHCLRVEDKELLKKFADGLGVSDIQGQTLNCDLYCELFKEQLKFAKENEKSSGRLYRILGFSLGCVVALMVV